MKDFGVRFFEAPALGQIGPQDRLYTITATSMSKAKVMAKALAYRKDWRLVEIFRIDPSEKSTFNAWFVNHITVE